MRRKTHEVRVGNTPLGGTNPIRVQSMTTTSTMDTDGSVAQVLRIVEAGGEYVRLTTQGDREAKNLEFIEKKLRSLGCNVPLVADVHFNAHVADVAALYAQKVRINPGNYVDPARKFQKKDYTEAEYADEIAKIEQRFVPFLRICREHGTAVRIGVNHGSLSDRIMSRYGDTPEGMVESCMEFLRICVKEDFKDVVISIKASNTVVMVRTVRLLVQQMEREGMDFPLHLGVTEAGEGEDGRVKSAVGIGALLCEGIGDTIRVSLSEAPEREIPVARKMVDSIEVCTALRAQLRESVKNGKLSVEMDENDWEALQLKVAMAVGALLIDGVANDLEIHDPHFSRESLDELVDSVLQAARVKMTKPEFISCPGCGRTLYDLEETIARIKQAVLARAKENPAFRTLKIGIMGCIVNGPGEMADADYGYVGAAAGKVSLYKQKECIEKNIPADDAVDRLIAFIEEDLKK